MRVKYDEDTKLLFHIGDPLEHSCAAYIHNAMYELAHVNAVSLTKRVRKGELKEFIQACKLLDVWGFDITMPHKSDVIPFCDEVETFSKAFKSVNHVKIRNGKMIGIGLDGLGMGLALEKEHVKIDGAHILFLGAGAVCGPIAAELCKRGAASITILNRTVSKADEIAATLNAYFSNVKTVTAGTAIEEMRRHAAEKDIVIQCTSLGMRGFGADYEDVSFIDMLPLSATVADVLFDPPCTKLLARAQARGLHTVNGMEMLVGQMKAMMKFHFDVELPANYADEGEESLLVAVAMRTLRSRRMQERNR